VQGLHTEENEVSEEKKKKKKIKQMSYLSNTFEVGRDR
jgi:hypothetical protein